MDPVRPTDDVARQMARGLLAQARTAALAVLLADGAPHLSRIALARDAGGAPLTLVSDLAIHARAMADRPRVSLLLDGAASKGNPLTHPRLTLTARAVAADPAERPALADLWLRQQPKARLYIGFADFRFVRFTVSAGFLNGGFGQAFRLTAADLDL